jgi:hypothetical protein
MPSRRAIVRANRFSRAVRKAAHHPAMSDAAGATTSRRIRADDLARRPDDAAP